MLMLMLLNTLGNLKILDIWNEFGEAATALKAKAKSKAKEPELEPYPDFGHDEMKMMAMHTDDNPIQAPVPTQISN